MPKQLDDINRLSTSYFKQSEKWDLISMCLRLVVFSGSILAIFISLDFLWLPIAAFLLSIAVEFVAWRAEALSGKADELKRIYEYADGFGQKLTVRDLSNLKAAALGEDTGDSFEFLLQGNIFASKRETGAYRVIENLMQSSWFSFHLARISAFCYLWLIVFLFFVSLVTLFYSVNFLTEHEELKGVGKLVTTVILLIFSLGLVRKCLGLFSFSTAAKETDGACEQALERGEVPEAPALRLLYDYQLARALSPSIPTWVWGRNRDRLNRLWDERINDNTDERNKA